MVNYSRGNTTLKKQTSPDSRFSVEYLRIPTVEAARSFFGPVPAKERAWRSNMYFNALLNSPRSKLGIGEHDRAEAYIFAGGAYPEGDKEAHKSHFPVSVKVMKIDELFIAPNETIDLSACAGEFPWHIGESEIYLYVTINRLILSAQSKLTVKGNVFILNCLKAIGNNLNGKQAIIELTGSAAAQRSSTSLIIPAGNSAYQGADGADGQPLNRESTPLGVRVSEGSDACNGQNGADGGNGSIGANGANGAMLFLSDLRFGQLEGFHEQSIKLTAAAAPGFPGSNGGDGGDGGKGGNGASGAITPFGFIKGYQGGNGGRGGNGGNGGRGGSGGLACDVFVSVPYKNSCLFRAETFASPGGGGGGGGRRGKGGAAGTAGALYEHDGSRPYTLNGEDGMQGMQGGAGKTRAAPGVHIYERY